MGVTLDTLKVVVADGPRKYHRPLAKYSTTYPVTAAPPSLDGAVQLRKNDWLPGVTAGDRGAVGTVRRTALTMALDRWEEPVALWATMRK